jgi:O-antigen/teichoic acid export membrane protein
LEGRIYGWVLSLLVQFIITLWLFGAKDKYIKFTFSKIDLLSLAAFGYPLIFHQLGKFVINQSDRLFIAKMVSIDEAGIYSIGYSLGSMMLLPIGAFSNFYTPFVYERLRRPEYEKKTEIVKTAYLFCLMILVSFVMIILLSPWFFNIFIDQKFHKGLEYVPWVALSYVFWGFYILLTAVIFYKGKTTFLGWLSLLNIILNCILNIVLIRIYGAIGAAFATTISFFIVFVLTAIYSSKLMPLPWLFFLSGERKNQ